MDSAVTRRALLGLLGAGGLTVAAARTALAAPPPSPSAPPPDAGAAAVPVPQPEPAAPASWRAVAEDVRREVRSAWKSYVDKAFGHDQIKPLSGGFEEFFVADHPVGLTAIEALDALFLMELDSELEQGLDWVRRNASYDIDARRPALRLREQLPVHRGQRLPRRPALTAALPAVLSPSTSRSAAHSMLASA